jgi:hypothetical protein
MKFKMAATAGLSLTFDSMGKMFQNASSLKPLVSMSCGGGHLGFPIGIKNIKFVEDLPNVCIKVQLSQPLFIAGFVLFDL